MNNVMPDTRQNKQTIPDSRERGRVIRLASITALGGNLVLSLLKIFSGIAAESLAVVGDGIDSMLDVLISVVTLVVAVVISRPADKGHPWGHGRAETVATAMLSLILFFAGAQLILNSVKGLVSGPVKEVPGMLALMATGVSIGGKILLSWTQYLFGKKAHSEMLKANAKNMAADVITSAGVLAGLFCAVFFKIGAIDLITAMLVGIWVIKNAAGIFFGANAELMDGSARDESYRALFDAVRSVPEAGHPHRTRMRRIAGFWDIDMDIEVDPDLTIREAHEIACKVEDAVKNRIEGVFDIMVHVEPRGNTQSESYGLSEAGLT
ncbi:MAG: cation diffusion facilitator family transporter [Treponema sp.]|jgi:cation diffusion facilitator family transporter|nr:cation diffusion facilitator family transporter [Treponema sp.]